TYLSYQNHTIISYGDAESHLNIAKRVVNSLTPGAAQLGGIWLPLPHVLMLPFIWSNFLWRSGLAGSIVSGICFLITSMYLYKLTLFLTKNKFASFIASLVFITNPNILYMQATPMTELPLIAFFVLNSYFFIRYLHNRENLIDLILAAFYGFCATLTRYDGWIIVLIEAGIIGLLYTGLFDFLKELVRGQVKRFSLISQKGEGILVMYCTLAFFGVALWLGWGALILKNPFYFTTSQFSAKSQQKGWLAKGQLPAYKNLPSAFVYYTATSMSNVGILIFAVAIVSYIVFIKDKNTDHAFFTSLVLLSPFIFYVLTLYMGQSLIFIPSITPVGFEWRLFNVRYGLMMIPTCALLFAYLFHKAKNPGRLVLLALFILQFGLYANGYSRVVSYDDATIGLSANKYPDAVSWLAKNYTGGLLVMDDYKRIFSVITSQLPMENIIYIGTKPYWEETLAAPQSHAQWIILQKDDALWKQFFDTPEKQGRLYKFYKKVYTSEDILIFERNL
ncbi:MAG: hypothetical protein AAB909_02155, partial [Patescibacteria group bacterium]